MTYELVAAITLDLDDTLWPVWPNIEAAERTLLSWLDEHAPRTSAAFDAHALRAFRSEVLHDHPEWAHDLGALRKEGLRRALQRAGDDPGLAEPGFDVFYAARQQVEMFDDAIPALERISRKYPLLALTNGNADIGRIGIARFFQGCVSAHEAGYAKPDPRIFHDACRRLGHRPEAVLHVGDDGLLDVAGALGAGMQAAWIDRSESVADAVPSPAQAPRYADMLMLADALGC